MSDTILTTRQVAEMFGVTPQSVVRWANEGKLRHLRTPGGHRRYVQADVDALKSSLTSEIATAGSAA